MLFIIFVYVIQSATFTKTISTSLGGNTYQNEMVAYLHVIWRNHAGCTTTTTTKLSSFAVVGLVEVEIYRFLLVMWLHVTT